MCSKPFSLARHLTVRLSSHMQRKLHPGEMWRRAPDILVLDNCIRTNGEPLDASFPFGSLLQVARSTLTQAPSDCGGKEHEGSTPGPARPLQITICTRHLRAELSSWRENKRVRKWERVGKMRPGCSQLFLPGSHSYCTHH